MNPREEAKAMIISPRCGFDQNKWGARPWAGGPGYHMAHLWRFDSTPSLTVGRLPRARAIDGIARGRGDGVDEAPR